MGKASAIKARLLRITIPCERCGSNRPTVYLRSAHRSIAACGRTCAVADQPAGRDGAMLATSAATLPGAPQEAGVRRARILPTTGCCCCNPPQALRRDSKV